MKQIVALIISITFALCWPNSSHSREFCATISHKITDKHKMDDDTGNWYVEYKYIVNNACRGVINADVFLVCNDKKRRQQSSIKAKSKSPELSLYMTTTQPNCSIDLSWTEDVTDAPLGTVIGASSGGDPATRQIKSSKTTQLPRLILKKETPISDEQKQICSQARAIINGPNILAGINGWGRYKNAVLLSISRTTLGPLSIGCADHPLEQESISDLREWVFKYKDYAFKLEQNLKGIGMGSGAKVAHPHPGADLEEKRTEARHPGERALCVVNLSGRLYNQCDRDAYIINNARKIGISGNSYGPGGVDCDIKEGARCMAYYR